MLLYDSRKRACECEVAFNRDGSAYLASGIYFDDESEVSDTELDYMQDNYVHELEREAFERAISRAEALRDEMRDRN